MITDDEIARFDIEGAATIAPPLPEALTRAAADAIDALLPPVAGGGRSQMSTQEACAPGFFAPPLLDLMQHPALEAIAARALRCREVVLRAVAVARSQPEPGKPFSHWEHVDITYRASDLDAVPRRMIASLLVWLCDVTVETAPLMYRPGSHRQIAEHMQRDYRPSDDPQGVDELPRLAYAPARPLLARFGEVTVCTTALIHGASVCTGPLPRRVVFLPFSPRGMPLRANMASFAAMRDNNRRLRAAFRPERAHLLADERELGLEPTPAA